MASTFQNLYLTPEQEQQLLQALEPSNSGSKAGGNRGSSILTPPTSNALSLSPSSFSGSPQQKNGNVNDSPYMDNYDYSFADSSYDFDITDATGQMIGDLPGGHNSDSTEKDGTEKEKRAHEDDEDDEATKSGNNSKRRESSERVPKKPGRKPLTSEPTSKRKAQNRAAQRAFRERKEKHLKDLEDKVVELEKKSEATSSENTQLRAQLDAVTTELNEYKRRMQAMGPGRSAAGGSASRTNNAFGHAAVSNLGDVNFQFEFPKFGMLPGPPNSGNKPAPTRQQTTSSIASLGGATNGRSPGSQQNGASPSSIGSLSASELASFSAVFAANQHGSPIPGARSSIDSGHFNFGNGSGTTGGAAATSSPSASSNSNIGGPSSSCGTSPEPFTQSPMGFKPLDTMTTIGEESASLTSDNLQSFDRFDGMDMGTGGAGFDWLAQQNGGQFDPQLFGDYREPQEQILANATFDDLFNDLDADFLTPYNMPSAAAAAASQQQRSPAAAAVAPKKNLIAEIDAKQNEDKEPMTKADKYNCTKVWEKLQNCPKVKSGDIDLDNLCGELTKKAKCSGQGPVIKDQDFDTILKKYLGEDLAKQCADSKAQGLIP